MKSSHRKRAPFGEAPADLGNRRGGAAADDGGARGGGGGRTRAVPPSTIVSKSKPRRSAAAPVPSVLVKSGTHRSKSRDRRPSSQHHHRRDPQQQQQQQRDPSQSQSPERSTSTADAHANPKEDDASRARLYKAEAYEAKVRLASRDQRIDALQAELEEVRLFQKVEHDASAVRRDAARRDADERAGRKKSDDAELIEALAQELETMEGDLHAAQDRLRGAEKDVAERRRAEADVRAALAAQEVQSEDREADLGRQLKESRMLLERQERDLWAKFESEHQNRVSEAVSEEQAQWKKRESDLKGSIERLQVELTQANNDAKEGCAILKELHGELRKARNERDDLRSQASTLRDARSDAEEAARSARAEADDRAARCDNLEKSNKELQGVLVTIQGQSAKKVEQVRREVAEARAREEALRDENRALVEAHEREVAEARAREEALREENRALVEAREKEEERTKEACDREEALVNDYNVLVEAHEQEEERAKAAEEKLKEAEERTKEACAREEALRNDHDVMVQRAQEMEELETDLEELAKNCDEQEKELSSKAAAIEELQSNRLEQERENDVEKLRAKEREMEELRSALDATESQSKEKIEQLEIQVLSLKKDHERLSEKHEQELNESQEMENHLEHLIDKCEEQEKELSARAAAIDDLKEAHAANTKRLELEHATEMKKLTDNQRSHEQGLNELQEMDTYVQELETKCDEQEKELETQAAAMEEAERLHASDIEKREKKISKQAAAMEKLKEALADNLNKLDMAYAKDMEKFKDSERDLHSLDKANKDLQNELDSMKTQSSKEINQLKFDALEAQAREKALKQDHRSLVERYGAEMKKVQDMASDIEDLAKTCDEQEEELSKQAAAMDELKRLHASNIEKLEMEHAIEIDQKKGLRHDVASLEKANNELQDALESMKSLSGKEIDQLKFDVLEAQSREKVLAQDHKLAVVRYEAEIEKLDLARANAVDKIKVHEKANDELRNALDSMKDMSGKEIDQLKFEILEAQSREKALMQDHKSAAEEYEAEIKELDVLHAKDVTKIKGDMASLEKANKDLQDSLESMKSLSGKEIDQLKFEILEAQSREKALARDRNNLVERYETERKRNEYMKSNLDVMSKKYHEQEMDTSNHGTAMDELKEMHASNIERLELEHALEIEQMKRIERDLETLQKANKEQEEKLSNQDSAIWASKDSHATNVASIKCGYELDIEKMLQNESSLKTRHVRELKMKDDLRKSREAYWESRLEDLRAAKHESSEASESNYIAEIKVLKDSMTSVRTDMESQLDKLRSENSKLRTENDDLSQKLHRGLGIHKRTATDLEAKTLELNKLQTNAERVKAEVEEFDSLKKDYASAVELSISRGKKIQSLEQDVETYYSKLAKTIQKMKNMDSNSSSNELLEEEVSSLRLKARESENKISSLKQELQLAEESARASERLQAEVSSLRSKAMESEERISELMEELQCYDQTDEINERLREELSSLRAKDLESNQMIAELEDQLLFVDQLDRDLTGARKENDLLQSKVRYLEEALRDASAALKVVSSQKKPSPRKSNPRDHEDMLRRQIEESALQEYYAQRMQR
ncbi:hypothetical protein ACHAWF_018380 [Thalassiosira exigua]